MKIAAIVVTFNRKDMLRQCIQRILEQKEADCDLIIIDNASTDGTEDLIQRINQEHKLVYFNTGKNLGGAGGFQYGLKKAYQLGYDGFWLMDDDTYPEANALKELLRADSVLHGEYGFLSSVTLWKDGTLCNMNVQRVSVHQKIREIEDELTPVVMATFVSFFLRRNTVEKFGLPLKEFFIWSDDLEYSRRISRELMCYVVRDSRVIHFMQSNEKVGIEKESIDRLWRYEYLYRNEVYLYRREGIKGWIYLLARMGLHSMRILQSDTKDKRRKLQIIWKSFAKGLRFNPRIEYVQT